MYKKPAFWFIVLAVITAAVLAVCFLINPKDEKDLSFLNYESLVALAGQSFTLSAHISSASETNNYEIDRDKLAAYLDNAQWTAQRIGMLRLVQRRAEKSTTSIQIQFDNEIWLTIFDTDTAYIYHDGAGRYYRLQDGDYEKALVLGRDTGIIAISGESSIPVVVYGMDIAAKDIKDSLYWLDIVFAENESVPFQVFCDGFEQHGQYSIYDAETFEALDYMSPSGLDSQTYIFQKTIPGRAYIVTLLTHNFSDGIGDLLCFGVNVSSDSTSTVLKITLTLDDVKELSQKGENLTWEDFDQYQYIETGSGLYIRVYEIDQQFSIWIGGGSTSDEPMYIYLKSNENPDDYIDIRVEDVEAFISKHASDQ